LITKLVPGAILGLVFSELLLIAGAYILAAALMVNIDTVVWLVYEDGAIRIAIITAGIVIGLYFQDLYNRVTVHSRFLLLQQISLVLGAGFLFQALLSYGSGWLALPRWVMMVGSLIVLLALPAWRILYSTAMMHGAAAERVLFLGCNQVAQQIAKELKDRPELGMSAIGFVADQPESDALLPNSLLGPVSAFRRLVKELNPGRIVVGMAERRQRMPVDELLELNLSGHIVEDAASAYENVFGRISVLQLRPSQLIFSRELGPRPLMVKLQSIYSFALALIGLVLFAPIMLVVAVLVKLTSPGPILYRQKRVGRNGAGFTVLKFRSMQSDAEAETGAVWAQRDDPRVTMLGRFLRKLRLDELPQLINVLRGEMSVVGPRPERPEFVATLSEKIPFYRQRHYIKPGITGWAQINHKYGDTMEDTITKLEYDLYYIKNLSPALDFYIIFHTLKVMILSRGSQ